jgi:transcriptional regulator with XRE-family HTH domain
MDEFSTRLKELLDYLNVTPVSLAEKMGVQRTSFNHLLSGRNKPGFEFLTRLHSCYPSINLNWLISGYGSITEKDEFKISQVENIESKTQTGVDLFSNIFQSPLKSSEPLEHITQEDKTLITQQEYTKTEPTNEESLDRLILVYSSGKMVEIKQ